MKPAPIDRQLTEAQMRELAAICRYLQHVNNRVKERRAAREFAALLQSK